MPCSWRTSHLQLLLILTVFLEAGYISAGMGSFATSSNSTHQMGQNNNSLASSVDGKQKHSKLPADVNTSLTVLEDTKAVLFCPPVLLTKAVVTTWEIILRDKPPCIKAHRRDKNETAEANCTDERITWTYRPDQNVALQIDPVVIAHEGFYMCQVVTPDGNFHRGYYLQVLVTPEVTLFQSQNRTAVCKAVAGKPAAHIFWTPEGDCVPEHKYWENGTVTVQSTCFWAESNVSAVTCFVSHEARNWSRSIELKEGANTSESLKILFIILPIFILVIMGSIWLLRIIGCRKCKLKKTDPTPVEEDEMQPYESYMEKSNPLYDTTNRVLKISQMLQSKDDSMSLHTL
ncbi:cell surface glycoprotein CD200 receptor 1 [Pteronotus mesoamericanus]|uniref:cell surface glycoprotein CD200 receptor 1 n=1 Tax=Pteronotus mesoamericanus TaxID=1884717 RepID=UPI0023EBAB4E|nr:cell surface glycoprotein CD200 receptor 1 [Pteronotus parnellii mesoamericanus]